MLALNFSQKEINRLYQAVTVNVIVTVVYTEPQQRTVAFPYKGQDIVYFLYVEFD
jgi:hypothetical protein